MSEGETGAEGTQRWSAKGRAGAPAGTFGGIAFAHWWMRRASCGGWVEARRRDEEEGCAYDKHSGEQYGPVEGDKPSCRKR